MYTNTNVTAKEVTTHPNELYYIHFKCDCESLYEFKCPYLTGLSIYESLDSCYKSVTRNGRILFAWSTPEIGNQGYAFCKSSPTTKWKSSVIMTKTGIFLRDDYNHSLKEEICSRASELYRNNQGFSRTEFIRTRINTSPAGYKFYMISYENEFLFITSDGTYEVKTTFSEYLRPLGNQVRWCLLLILIGTVLLLTGFTFKPQKFVLVLINSLFHIFGIIMEQGTDFHSLTTQKSALDKARKILFFFFIPSSMILGILYKSALKSDFTIPAPYQTTWKYLKQLVDSDFEIFVPMEDCIINVSLPHSSTTRRVKYCKPGQPDLYESHECEEHMLEQQYASYQRAVMIFDEDILNFDAGKLPEYYSTIMDLGSQTTYVCLEDFQEFVQTNLSQSKTALVVFRREFDYYFRLVKKRQGVGTKFGHNLGSNDSLLKKPKGFYISNTGDDSYNLVHRRMNALLFSGIYWFWEKWLEMRRDFEHLSKRVEPKKAIAIVDFELALKGWFTLLMICIGAFSSEILLVLYTLNTNLLYCANWIYNGGQSNIIGLTIVVLFMTGFTTQDPKRDSTIPNVIAKSGNQVSPINNKFQYSQDSVIPKAAEDSEKQVNLRKIGAQHAQESVPLTNKRNQQNFSLVSILMDVHPVLIGLIIIGMTIVTLFTVACIFCVVSLMIIFGFGRNLSYKFD
ncbi:unnamed protein product [Allacma fusca]|uniref:Uncharacterized protein n=1 Tax=Allacma fusca TaxID=39272 RepID=A0A8J2LGV2_9HEXA|nr:unnamed protein product [Allacma fusca]